MSQLDQREGWYPDPDGTPGERWWNGTGWTEAVRGSDAERVRASRIAAPAADDPKDKRREPVYHRRGQSTPSVVRPPADRPDAVDPGSERARNRSERLLGAMPHRVREIAIANPSAYWSAQVGVWSLLFFAPLLLPSIVAIVLAVRGLGRAEALSVAGDSVTGYARAGVGLATGVFGLIVGGIVVLFLLAYFLA